MALHLSEIEHVTKYALVFVVALVVTWGVTPMLMRLARRVGLMDEPGGRHLHAHPTPLCGGIALFCGVHIAFGLTFVMGWGYVAGHLTLQAWRDGLLASGVVLLFGMLDDRLHIRPWVKLLGQVAVGLIVYSQGVGFSELLGMPLPSPMNVLATILWFAIAMNAFNLIDGMDGLASGLGLIAALGLAVFSLFHGAVSNTLFMLALAGGCMGFLRFNYHPARAFLGDAGSMLIGFLLAWFALLTHTKIPTVAALAVPVLAMGIPLLDAVLAVWRRAARQIYSHLERTPASSAIFSGDRDHLHHRLQAAGFSQRRAAWVLFAGAAALVTVALVAMMLSSYRAGVLMAAFAAFVYVVVRHLARIELIDSGRLIARGLRRPPSTAWCVFLAPLLDLGVLAVSFALVVAIVYPVAGLAQLKSHWLAQGPVAIGLPFLVLTFSGTYRRVWSRARISEYGVLAFWLISGIAVAVTICDSFSHVGYRRLIGSFLAYVGAAVPGVMAVRVLPRLLQDAVAVLQRYQRGGPARTRVLLYGAGFRATLFLREQSFRSVEEMGRLEIEGFLDDDRNLQGRVVHGCPVIGTLDALTHVIDSRGIQGVVITADVGDEKRRRVGDVCERKGVSVWEWRPVMSPLNSRGLR